MIAPIAVLVFAVLIACWWWMLGVELDAQGIALGLVVLVAIGFSWPVLVPAIIGGAPLGFAVGLACRLWAELVDLIAEHLRRGPGREEP